MCNDLVYLAEGWVDVDGMVEGPGDGKEIGVGVGGVMVACTKSRKLGVEGGGHGINLGECEVEGG